MAFRRRHKSRHGFKRYGYGKRTTRKLRSYGVSRGGIRL